MAGHTKDATAVDLGEVQIGTNGARIERYASQAAHPAPDPTPFRLGSRRGVPDVSVCVPANSEYSQMTIGWTDEREHLFALLAELDEEVGALYHLAIENFSQDPFTRPLLMIGSHCIREMFSPLLRAQQIETPKRSDVSSPSRALASAWSAAGLMIKPDSSEAAEPDELRAIPNDVFVAARSVVAAEAKGTENAKSVVALVALGPNAPGNAGLIKRLHDAQETFVRWSHHPGRHPLPAAEKIESNLQVVEGALLTRLSNRADRVRNIKVMLGRANAKLGSAES